MEGLKIKSDENIRGAEILNTIENRCFASSIHCSYYSCLQYMAYVIKVKKLISGTLKEEQNLRKKGSHEIIRNIFEIYYAKNIDHKNFLEYKEWIGQLEQNRIESDYWEQKIEQPLANKSLDLAKRILSQIKKIK
ncbi:MAG TPA: hypothetical protein VFW07_14670 [Parafilimonas sp.]|nr:hypothetical protein [Parafilimonas sp.]